LLRKKASPWFGGTGQEERDRHFLFEKKPVPGGGDWLLFICVAGKKCLSLGSSLAVLGSSWQFLGSSLAVPWQFLGSSLAVKLALSSSF